MSLEPDAQQQSTSLRRRVAVIGGGLAGLSAAHRVCELAIDQPIDVSLFESSNRLGGLVGTEKIGDYLVDVGADSFLTTKPGAINLCRRLGIEDRLVSTDSRFRGAMVLYKGRPHPIPEGFQLLSPTAIWPIIKTPILSITGKLRLLMEWFVARRAPRMVDPNQPELAALDESLAQFARRRFGNQALDRLIQPLVGGIYTSDPEKLSLAATMPRFLEMEQQHGSLIRAALRQKQSLASSKNGPRTDTSSGARYGQFAGLKGGMDDLVQALHEYLQSRCDVRLNTIVIKLEQSQPSESATRSRYRLSLGNGTMEDYDAVIIATAADQASSLLKPENPSLSAAIRQIEHASSALVISGHRLADIQNPMKSFGLVIPHKERRKVLAVSFSSRKFPDRAPADRILLRTFVGGAMQPELLDRTDEELVENVKAELSDIFGVSGQPDFVKVYRYRSAMPQYHVGHLNRIHEIEQQVKSTPGLALTGIAYRGVGIPDVITDAELAAEQTVQFVKTNSTS